VALAAVRELRSPSPTAPLLLFVYAMLALGFGLSGGVEILTLDGDVGRMNTVFKFYLHVWMMWGVVGAFGLWYLFAVMRPQEAFLARGRATRRSCRRRATCSGFAVFSVLALVYPYFGTRAHPRPPEPGVGTGRRPGVPGQGGPYINKDPNTGWAASTTCSTRDGINWIRANVKGSPTTIEAIGPSYRSLGRVRFTLAPTVSGLGSTSRSSASSSPSASTTASATSMSSIRPRTRPREEILRKYDGSG
jgi:hypothetical protein